MNMNKMHYKAGKIRLLLSFAAYYYVYLYWIHICIVFQSGEGFSTILTK